MPLLYLEDAALKSGHNHIPRYSLAQEACIQATTVW